MGDNIPFFNDSNLKSLDNGNTIWLVNVLGDGNCGYHAWLSAVVNNNNTSDIKDELVRKGIIRFADKNKKFISSKMNGKRLRNFLYQKTHRTERRNKFMLNQHDYDNAKARIKAGDTFNGGVLGRGWMENELWYCISYNL